LQVLFTLDIWNEVSSISTMSYAITSYMLVVELALAANI